MSVNLTALLERVAALEARDGDSLVTVEDCGPYGFPDYGENATNPDGVNTCVLVYSTVWFWLGAACILGGIHMALGIRGDPGNSQILLWSGPSILLLGGYQRDYDVAGYVLVGLSFCLLVILVYVKFQETFNSELWNSEDTFSSSKASRETTKNEGGRADSESAAMPAAGAAAVAVAVDSETENVGTELKATNVYSDVETPFLIVLVYGAAKIMLVGFYIYSLYTNGRPDFTSTDTYIFYFAGCLFQIICFSKHQNSDTYILSNIRKGTLFKDDKPVVVAERNIFVRQVLDIAINVCAAPVIYISLPHQLAGTSKTYFDFLLI